jgi:3-phenylpropionate/trans-cinnamate dioxygenase ferredoxin component
MGKTLIGKQSDFGAGLHKVTVEGKDDIVLANIDGKFYAMKGTCNHQGGPLYEGELEGNVITCPWHGAKWDVTSGKLVEFPVELDDEPTYKVITEGDELFIEV